MSDPKRKISATDDARTENTVRHKYRVLNDLEKQLMDVVKDKGADLLEAINAVAVKPSAGRECAIARTKAEEAVMWAVKGLTK